DTPVRSRRHWKHGIEVLHDELAVDERKTQLLPFQNFTERTTENRKENLALQRSKRRMPIDVEVRRVWRFRAVLENVHPPQIFAAGRHVIRDDVKDHAHAVSTQSLLKSQEISLASQLRIESGGIDDVIPVHTSTTAAQDRRCVDVSDSEIEKITE